MSKPRSIRPRLRRLSMILLLLLAAAGCGDRSEKTPAARTSSETGPPRRITSDPDLRPLIVCDLSAAEAWLDLGRIGADDDAFARLLKHPVIVRLAAADPSQVPTAEDLAEATRRVFSRPEYASGGLLPTVTNLTDNLGYLRSRLDALPRLIEERLDRPHLDRLRGALLALAPADRWPGTLYIDVYAGRPVISFIDPDRLAVDLGLITASGQDQAVRLLAGRFWSTLAPLDGVAPALATNAADRLTGVFRQLRHEGLGAWLARYPDILFDKRHPRLKGSPQGEPAVLGDAARLLDQNARMVATALEAGREKPLQTAAERFEHALGVKGRYDYLGWAMIRLIVEDLGEDALGTAAADTKSFLAAYQTAALKTQATTELDRLPALPPDLYTFLMKRLAHTESPTLTPSGGAE